MAYRFTDTNKWHDSWFVGLTPDAKLLFNFLCDNCDIAGFIEIIPTSWIATTGLTKPRIEGALKGLQRGLIFSLTGDCVFIRNFLKHQKNLPLNPEKNMAHRGIVRRFELYMPKFDLHTVEDFFTASSKPIQWGNDIGNGTSTTTNTNENGENWRNDFEIYISELREVYHKLLSDKKWMDERKKYHPNLNIELSLEKSCVEFWATEAGWIHKKKSKTNIIDWNRTLTNALDIKKNQVYDRK